MSYPVLHLKPGREASLSQRHPWVFSGALEGGRPGLENGSLVHVSDKAGSNTATGTFSSKSMISVRIFSFAKAKIDYDFIRDRIRAAHDRRRLLGLGIDDRTTGYRVVYGESDGLPGLVIDRYGDVYVLQMATAGIEQFKEDIVAALHELFSPTAIFNRSDLPDRSEEGLSPKSGPLAGKLPESVTFAENGRTFVAEIESGQKTGFYLDQRDLRQEIVNLARDRSVVDLFSYTGSATIAALTGGATHAVCVDSSASALARLADLARLNGIDSEKISAESSDVFQWLGNHSDPQFDMVLLDPPALIKSRKHIEDGRKGYHFLNRAALRIVNDGGILVTSSCSGYFTEEDLRVTLRRASTQAGVDVHILKMIRQSPDHPVAINFPESLYLKSIICQVRR